MIKLSVTILLILCGCKEGPKSKNNDVFKDTDVTQNATLVCMAPPTGMAPDEGVVAACRNIKTQQECTEYKSEQFPYRCVWDSPSRQQDPIP